jgi:dynein heavy chain, axonemal
MRELSSVFGGICKSHQEYINSPLLLQRLWLHETLRVYKDRLIDEEDSATLELEIKRIIQTEWKNVDMDTLFATPLIFTDFAGPAAIANTISSFAHSPYVPLPTGANGSIVLSKSLTDKLEDYNSTHPNMDLVIFDEAAEHVARITRILSSAGGHALLVGVGGSGKQSYDR